MFKTGDKVKICKEKPKDLYFMGGMSYQLYKGIPIAWIDEFEQYLGKEVIIVGITKWYGTELPVIQLEEYVYCFHPGWLSPTSDGEKSCKCEINILMAYGCKCGSLTRGS